MKIETITLGEIATALTFIVAFIGTIIAILKYAKSINNKLLEPINQKLDKMDQEHTKKIERLELSYIKTDLVDFMNDIENDVPKNEIQKKNAYELYDRYKELRGNSYVESSWEKLKKEGKI